MRRRMLEGSLWVYRRLLAVYSPEFRARYGADMTRLFRRRCRRAEARGGLPALALCWFRALLDIAGNGPLERLAARRRRVGAAGGPCPTATGGSGVDSAAAPGRRFHPTERPATAAPPLPSRRGDDMMQRIWENLRFATRTLAQRPAYTATLVLTLALGTGATIALFSVVDAALVRPLPYPDADRLYSVVQIDPNFGPQPFAPPYLADLRERTRGFELLVGFSPTWTFTMTGLGEPALVGGAFVSDAAFALFGVAPLEGRVFTSEEHAPGGPRVVMVGRGFWDRHFGPGSRLNGQSVRLDGEPFRIVGILPNEFRLPLTASLVSQGDRAAELWLPFALNPYADLRIVPVMNVVGRLRPEVTATTAEAELQSVGVELAREYPDSSRWTAVGAVPLYEVVTAGSKRSVLMLFAAAACLLLIACANVANLLLARSATRREEFAVRSSLGASRSQIIGQLLAEGFVVAIVGCGAGLLLAGWALAAVPALGLQELPPSSVVRVDLRVAGFSVLLAGLTTLLFGLAPAWQTAGVAPAAALRAGARTVGGASRVRSGLVVAEVALALVLLVGGGLLARSFWQLTGVDPGFEAEGLIGVPLSLSADRYSDPQSRLAFVDEIGSRVAALPGAERVAAVNRLPLSGSNVFVGVEIEGQPETGREPVPMDRRVVTPEYFETMAIPILGGRDFAAADEGGSAARVAIVNRTVARRFWPEGGALGRRLRLMLQSGPGPWLTVVGVVGDVHHHGLDEAAAPEVYVPYAQASVQSIVLLVRSRDDLQALTAAVKEQVWALDRDLPLDRAGSVEAVLDASVAEPRLRALVLNGFAVLALALAAVGLYGIVSYSVARHTRDIGVRVALGARSSDILRMVVLHGLGLTALGCAIGLAVSLLLTRALASVLFGVSATDPLTFAAVTLLLGVIAALASLMPARRAARVDPVQALRGD